MTSLQFVLLIGLVVAMLLVALWHWNRSDVFKRASSLAREIFPVWAAQGPFESGQQSAAAMRYAYLVVRGPEETEQMAETISKHAQKYDDNPVTWEKLRQVAEKQSDEKTEEYVTLANGMAAMDSLNKEFLERGGHKLEYASKADGSLGIAYKQIWSDEEIEEKKKENNEAILSGIGKGLLDDGSNEAKELLIFLCDVHKSHVGEEPNSPIDIGKAYFACLSLGTEEPLSEVAREFERLNEAHQAILESTEITLRWSSNPGANEAHLIRRYKNLYFPEPRRRVSRKDLAEAKKIDKEDYISCQQQFEQLGRDFQSLSPAATSGDLLKLRERLDELILLSLGVGGPAQEIASKADQVRDAVIAHLHAAFSNDKEALKSIEKAATYHKDNTRRFYIPVMAQMLRGNSPILKEETIPTILPEDPSAIAIFMNSLPEDSRAVIRVEALKIMREALDDGHIDPQWEEKIFALGGDWPIKQG